MLERKRIRERILAVDRMLESYVSRRSANNVADNDDEVEQNNREQGNIVDEKDTLQRVNGINSSATFENPIKSFNHDCQPLSQQEFDGGLKDIMHRRTTIESQNKIRSQSAFSLERQRETVKKRILATEEMLKKLSRRRQQTETLVSIL